MYTCTNILQIMEMQPQHPGNNESTVKPDLISHSKIDKTKALKTGGSLVQESIANAPMHSAVLSICIKRLSVLKTYVWIFF